MQGVSQQIIRSLGSRRLCQALSQKIYLLIIRNAVLADHFRSLGGMPQWWCCLKIQGAQGQVRLLLPGAFANPIHLERPEVGEEILSKLSHLPTAGWWQCGLRKVVPGQNPGLKVSLYRGSSRNWIKLYEIGMNWIFLSAISLVWF